MAALPLTTALPHLLLDLVPREEGLAGGHDAVAEA